MKVSFSTVAFGVLLRAWACHAQVVVGSIVENIPCIQDETGANNMICNANDIQVSEFQAVDDTVESCVEGQDVRVIGNVVV